MTVAKTISETIDDSEKNPVDLDQALTVAGKCCITFYLNTILLRVGYLSVCVPPVYLYLLQNSGAVFQFERQGEPVQTESQET